jgi:lipopolysaccharide transport system permease protein
LAFLTALGVGLWLSALNLKYRDFTYVIPFLIQFWFFVTPVVYASTIIPARWQLFYSLNPMVGVVEGFRWALLGQQNLAWSSMIFSCMVILALFVGGVLFFRHMEIEFADVV